ncbi:hypothetical protein N9I71_04710 [Amylibacter sp.]|nr:hypothetical protein [Amylibacter sp.]
MVVHLKSLERLADLRCHPKPLISAVVAQLKPAYLWLQATRAKASPNADIWDLRRTWAKSSKSVDQQVCAGTYRFKPLHRTGHIIGPVARGFDFLGYTYSPAGLGLAEKTIRNHRVKLHRLYEQYLQARKGAPRAQIEAAITTYIARWTGWVTGGLHGTFQLDVTGALRA